MAIRFDECVQVAFLCLAVATAASGLTLLAVGVTALAKEEWQLLTLLDTALYPAVGGVLTAVGALVTLLGALAACGVRLEDRRLLAVFCWVTLGLLVASGIAMVVAFSTGAQTALQDIHARMLDSTERYWSDANVRRQWDALQSESLCCGVDGGADWAPVMHENRVPNSCCMTPPERPQDCTASTGSYNAGCLRKVSAVAETFSSITGGTSSAVAVVLLLTMVVAYAFVKDSAGSQSYSPICTCETS